MVFELSATVNDTAQTAIDGQLTNTKLIRTTMVLNNQKGSFSLKKGVLATFINGESLSFSGGEGRNALHFVTSNGVDVAQFNQGVLRFEKSTGIQSLNATACKVAVAESDIQTLQITNCYLQMLSCQPQSGSITGGGTESFDNTYQSLKITDGTFYSQGDTFQNLILGGNAQVKIIKGTISGDLTITDNAMVHLEDCTFTTLEATGQLTLNKGTGQTMTLNGTATIALIDGTQVESMTVSDGSFTINNVNASGSLTASNCTVNSINLQAETTTCDSAKAIFSGGNLGDVVLTSTQITLVNNTVESLTATGGAINSRNNTGSAFTMEGGNLTSFNDGYETITATGLTGPNTIKGSTASDVTAAGDNSSRLYILGCTSEQITLSDFGFLEAANCSPAQLALQGISFVVLNDCNVPRCDVTNCKQFMGAGSNIVSCTVNGVLLSSTNEVGTLTATECGTLIDTGSTIQMTGGILSGTDSIVQGVDCLANMNGGAGDFTGDSVVLSTAADITNTEGLSVGKGFDFNDQAASLLYDGTALTASTTVGDVNIIATTGAVTVSAALGIANSAGAGITNNAVGEISNNAATIANTATTSITLSAPSIVATMGAWSFI